MVALVSRTGRQLQRYNSNGSRLVVGCIPYRYKAATINASDIDEALEVLLVTSQKGNSLMFPKGGWENDETVEEAAAREAMEEAGVRGILKKQLGKWRYKGNGHEKFREAYAFPLHVRQQLDLWPEKNSRERRWVSTQEAMEGFKHSWMKEALQTFLDQLSRSNSFSDRSRT